MKIWGIVKKESSRGWTKGQAGLLAVEATRPQKVEGG